MKVFSHAVVAIDGSKLKAVNSRDFNAPEILACEQAGIIPLVPKPLTSNSRAEGRFDKRDFIYDPQADTYQCSAGETATHCFTAEENGLTLHKYWSSACPACPMRAKCMTASYRRISRWEHEHVLETMQLRLDARPRVAVTRKQTVAHVVGTLKAWLGTTPLLTKTLPKVRPEISLAGLAYDMKRMIKIAGMQGMLRTIAAELRLPCFIANARTGSADDKGTSLKRFYTASADSGQHARCLGVASGSSAKHVAAGMRKWPVPMLCLAELERSVASGMLSCAAGSLRLCRPAGRDAWQPSL